MKGLLDWKERFMKMPAAYRGAHCVRISPQPVRIQECGIPSRERRLHNGFQRRDHSEELADIEFEANRAVWKDLKVETVYPVRGELDRMEYRSKIEILGPVRIIVIPGYDRCACCAPHVERTGEIGLIKLTNVQRYKGGVRVTMLCA